jgi:hypothetical protein
MGDLIGPGSSRRDQAHQLSPDRSKLAWCFAILGDNQEPPAGRSDSGAITTACPAVGAAVADHPAARANGT